MTTPPIRPEPSAPGPGPALRREVGLPGAVLLGLGSIVGTGVFVSVGVAAGVAGSAVVAAIALAALLATFNGLSSARLAATYPVSGGTYEYAHRTLDARLGFLAGWTFLCAKSASAATAALGCAGYLLTAAGVDVEAHPPAHVGLALGLALLVTLLVLGGVRRSNRANAALVTVTLGALAAFVAVGLARAPAAPALALLPADGPAALLHATALLFVAFTGYGRIATLGEEVRDPARTIPRAVVVTLVVSAALYLAVAAAAVAWVGADGLARATRASAGAALGSIARGQGAGWLGALLALGAVTAMGGVLVNLVLGLSRVALAMGRRGDLPSRLAGVDEHGSPRAAVLACGVVMALLTLVGDVKATWEFSAFTVLVYYAVTNLAALRLAPDALQLPRALPVLGLLGCVSLAVFVDRHAWAAGLGLIAAGFVLRALLRRRA